MNTYKIEILKMAFEARSKEVIEYQVNIDNYRLAMENIDSKSEEEIKELSEFRQNLKVLHDTTILERKKSQVILDVIKQQLEECNVL